jgi:hypothetical protein
VVASFLLPIAFGIGSLQHLDRMAATQGEGMHTGWYVLAFVFYLVQYSVIFFFNTALVGAAMIRLEGGDPSVRDGLALAWSKLPQILGYAAIAATVGVLLRALEERAGFIGRIVIGLLGVAWSVATFLVVPILAATNTGPVDAVKQSASLLKRSWGENIIGNGGVGLVFGFINVLLVVVIGGLAALSVSSGQFVLAATLGVIGVLALVLSALIHAALQGIYSAALYRYVQYGDEADGFDGGMMQAAFRHR